MSIKIVGELEVDAERGVIYFHNYTTGISNLRLSGLREKLADFNVMAQIDLTIPVVVRSDMESRRHPGQRFPIQPRNFFLGDKHTTHVSKAQARRERTSAMVTDKVTDKKVKDAARSERAARKQVLDMALAEEAAKLRKAKRKERR